MSVESLGKQHIGVGVCGCGGGVLEHHVDICLTESLIFKPNFFNFALTEEIVIEL